jgi:hypothetical protein
VRRSVDPAHKRYSPHRSPPVERLDAPPGRCDCSPAGASGFGVPKWRPFPQAGRSTCAFCAAAPPAASWVHQNASTERTVKSPCGPQAQPLYRPFGQCIKTDTKSARARRGEKRAIGGGNVEHRLVRRTGRQHQANVGLHQPPRLRKCPCPFCRSLRNVSFQCGS